MKNILIIALMLLAAYCLHLVNEERQAAPEDLNEDGVVDLTDFSIALALANNIAEQLKR